MGHGGDDGHGKQAAAHGHGHDDHGHGGHGHDSHGHDDHGHGGHGHSKFAPLGTMPPKPAREIASVPSFASQEYVNEHTAFEPNVFMPPPRTFASRWRDVLFNWYNDPDRPELSEHRKPPVRTVMQWLTKSCFPLKPETYIDPYTAPNKCPEEFWYNPWRWPNTKRVNPKISPPIDGRYNDFYHYYAFKYWLRTERDVYVMHLALLQEMMLRCSMKEGVNAVKNCRHLWNKYFSMSRHEEFTQSLLYMAMTGNTVIRETPYPDDFIDQKRKIYDDWLTRTRMKKPGDHY